MADERPRRPKLSRLWRLVALLRPHRVRFYLAVFALLVGAGITLIYPQAAQFAIDLGISGGSEDALDDVIMALLAVFGLHAALVWVRHYLMSWLGERAVADLRAHVFERLVRLPPGWFHDRRTGELVGRLAADVTIVEGVVGSELSIALRNVVQLVGGLALLLITNARLTGYMLLVVPPLTLGAVAFGRVIRRMSRRVQDRLATASGHVQEVVGAIQTVQAFVRERHEVAGYGREVEAAFGESISLARWRASFLSVVTTSGYVAITGVIWLGGREVIRGELSPGQLTAFMLYTAMVAGSLASVAGLWGSLQRAAGATERLFDIIDTVPQIRDPEDPVALPDGGGAVRFDDIEFTYPARPDHRVLDGVSVALAPGEVVALVGGSGAGKSTMTALLLRFYDPQRGAVTLEDVDVRRLALDELRGVMAIVAQEPVLFSGTVRDNIRYGRLDADDAAIEAAARDAHAHTFITSFPAGYDTLVGERGVQLSGGQKQRVAIARALLANPRVLILDEATSNLDAESEALVQEALARLMKGRTTLVIAHRLSTVRDAHRIVVLDKGRVVETGTHDELMIANGTYRQLIERQVIGGD